MAHEGLLVIIKFHPLPSNYTQAKAAAPTNTAPAHFHTSLALSSEAAFAPWKGALFCSVAGREVEAPPAVVEVVVTACPAADVGTTVTTVVVLIEDSSVTTTTSDADDDPGSSDVGADVSEVESVAVDGRTDDTESVVREVIVGGSVLAVCESSSSVLVLALPPPPPPPPITVVCPLDGSAAVVPDSEPEVALAAGAVTVTVAVAVANSRCLLATASRTESGIGARAIWQAIRSGAMRTTGSMSMQLSCMQVTRLGRKVDEEARQRHAMSEVEQVVSGDASMQSPMLLERERVSSCCFGVK